MKNFLFFIGGGLFVVLVSYASPKVYSCKDEVKKLMVANDSLREEVQKSQAIAEARRREAEQQTLIAEKQRTIADHSQEEALIQAERAVEAATEATRQKALANDYKKQLEACQKKN
ncbi:hypothetical protein [uncultured Imperialibacter sp.]|uniref:hypothetical protein n=1 Tax=uncultured Imperialibacter sp. TaxID=1672639 RepID=UPI0030D6EB2D|tara:strand:+ start:1119 stop:1466 length:348 start_codon:yes stop_codon:yes gene_type:complete